MIAISSAFWASAFLGCQKPEKSPTSDPQFDITQLSGQECLSPIGLQDEPFLTSELPVSNPESWSLIEPDAPTYASGGVIVLDADEDKDFDIISFSQSQPHLFINNGTGQFTEDNTRLPQLPDRLYNGGSAADFDNDGDDDLYFSTSESADVFLEHTPNGFIDRSNDIGVVQESGYSAAAAWADMDLDGDLDLLISGYGDDIITSSNGEFETAGPSHLYLNQGSYFEHQEYVKVGRGFTMEDGSQKGIEVDEHPDAFCDQVLQMIADDELVQAIGRVRGVNRTEHNKVKVILMANRVLPVAITKVVGAAELYPSKMQVAIARNGGVLIKNPKILSEKFPDLWSTEDACKRLREILVLARYHPVGC